MKRLIRFENWALEPDREPDAEPVTFAMECAVCGQRSPAGVDFGPVQDWTLRHSGRNPSHHTYRELIARPWRTWMHQPDDAAVQGIHHDREGDRLKAAPPDSLTCAVLHLPVASPYDC